MPEYTYLCVNTKCSMVDFKILSTISSHTEYVGCPVCHTETNQRVYDIPPIVYKANSIKQAMGFSKLEDGLKAQQALADDVANNCYKAKASQSYKKWKAEGKEDDLIQELAEANLKPDVKKIISTASNTVSVNSNAQDYLNTL